MIYNIHDIINDIHITVGETKRMNCPTCGGYNTFTITNNIPITRLALKKYI